MKIPFEPELFGHLINVHLILEYLAFFVAFRYYKQLKKTNTDPISNQNRLSIILAAVVGAFLGSRLMGFLENPIIELTAENIIHILNSKTIMGGIFGSLISVETIKLIIGEKQSSGDLFTLPLILGIFIGRIGCFLSGINEFTYGSETTSVTGMDLGDGLNRHPTSLYELIFLIFLYLILKKIWDKKTLKNGELYKLFMVSYFGFRFFIEFIKPNIFFVFGLSSIQWLCIICWIYYSNTIKKIIKHAY